MKVSKRTCGLNTASRILTKFKCASTINGSRSSVGNLIMQKRLEDSIRPF